VSRHYVTFVLLPVPVPCYDCWVGCCFRARHVWVCVSVHPSKWTDLVHVKTKMCLDRSSIIEYILKVERSIVVWP